MLMAVQPVNDITDLNPELPLTAFSTIWWSPGAEAQLLQGLVLQTSFGGVQDVPEALERLLLQNKDMQSQVIRIGRCGC